MISRKLRSTPETIQELLNAILLHSRSRKSLLGRKAKTSFAPLWSCARHLKRFLKEDSLHQLRIDDVVPNADAFERYLKERGLADASVGNMLMARRCLLRDARKLGWRHPAYAVADQWESALQGIKYKPGIATIVKAAIEAGIPPSRFSDAHLEDIGNQMTSAATDLYVKFAKARLRAALRNAGTQGRFPALNVALRAQTISLRRVKHMPRSLRTDVSRTLAWVRRRVAQKRLILDVAFLRYDLERLAGFLLDVRKLRTVHAVDALLRKDHVFAYVRWLRDVRHCKRGAVLSRLTRIHTLIQNSPRFRRRDFSWWLPMIRTLSIVPPSELRERRRRRQAPYEQLAEIPTRIMRDREALGNPDSKRAFWYIHDQLLMHMLVTALWPPANVRKCRIGNSRPNVWTGPLPKDDPSIQIPRWAERLERAESGHQFWLFHFGAEETWKGKSAKGLVLEELVDLMDLYMKCRQHIVARTDPGTLFVNRRGGALKAVDLSNLVRNWSRHSIGRTVVPWSIRDSFANSWLEKYPEDYENLADILWMEIPAVMDRYAPAQVIVA